MHVRARPNGIFPRQSIMLLPRGEYICVSRTRHEQLTFSPLNPDTLGIYLRVADWDK